MDFGQELELIRRHEELFARPGLHLITKRIYHDKLSAKLKAPFLYAGEHKHPDSQLSYSQDTNSPLSTPNPPKLLLGIESSFDDTSVSIVDSNGAVKANCSHRFTRPDVPFD